MRSCHYILDDQHRIVPVDLLAWAEWFETSGDKRIVAETMCGDYRVSTVFLGLDHNFFDDGPPVLWETMVFRGRSTIKWERPDRLPVENSELGELAEAINAAFEAMPRKFEMEVENTVDTVQLRCAGGWEQAEAMHAEAVARVEAVRALELPSAPEPTQKSAGL